MITTIRYRVKSLHGLLNRHARAVNYVWNYLNDVQRHALKWGTKWPSGFDFDKVTAGSSKLLGVSADTISRVCHQYAKSRVEQRKPCLRYRGKRSLGWIPVRGREIRVDGDGFRYFSKTYRVFKSRPLPEGKILDGTNFSQDSKGNWFLNIVVEVADVPARDLHAGVGIDLGLKEFATLSTGYRIEAQHHYRALEERLAVAQRARKGRRIRSLHARIAARRKDFLHKASTKIVRDFDYIVVGDVDASKLKKTKMAKSVGDAGWSLFRNMLRYKSIANGRSYAEVSESFTSQTCSSCGALPPERPKGIAGLRIREWACSACGAVHDRDVNAAINILRHALVPLAEGAVAVPHGEAKESP